jgi:cytochrome c-type biogenesis protein CcmH
MIQLFNDRWLRRCPFAFAPVVILALLLAARTSAQGSDTGFPTDNDVNTVAKKLYCPVCPNTPLDVCETKACQDWRAQIRDQLAAGWNEAQILDYFVDQYGELVLAEPRRSGFTSFVWLLPVIGVALGAGIVWQVLRSWRFMRNAPLEEVEVPVPQIAPELMAILERELQEMD